MELDKYTTSEEKKIIVSDLFVDIYRNFNVVTQVDRMRQLSKKELFLLLTLCLDKHMDEDPVVMFNFKEFKSESTILYEVQDDKISEDADILELIKESGDKYIETDNIVDSKGSKLPDPLTKEEVRDAKINIINE